MIKIDLSGKVALVTGGSGGLGSGIVRAMSEAGAAVVISDRGPTDTMAALVAEIQDTGGRAAAVYGDVSIPAHVDQMIAAAIAEFQAIDVLVNNAGVGFTADLVDTAPEDWDRVMSINLKGQYLCARAVARHMLATTSPDPRKIINIASEVGIMGLEGLTAYATSKAGVIGMTKSWAKELAPRRVHVNVIAPGPYDTPMLTEHERSPDYLATIPAGRLGRPDELGSLSAFLASPMGDFFVGQVLSPNGGVQI